MRRDHPLARLTRIRPEDLPGVPLIASRQLEGEDGLSGWLGYGYEKLRVVATGNLVNTLVLAVEEGMGCLFTLDKLVDLSGSRSLCFLPARAAARILDVSGLEKIPGVHPRGRGVCARAEARPFHRTDLRRILIFF